MAARIIQTSITGWSGLPYSERMKLWTLGDVLYGASSCQSHPDRANSALATAAENTGTFVLPLESSQAGIATSSRSHLVCGDMRATAAISLSGSTFGRDEAISRMACAFAAYHLRPRIFWASVASRNQAQ